MKDKIKELVRISDSVLKLVMKSGREFIFEGKNLFSKYGEDLRKEMTKKEIQEIYTKGFWDGIEYNGEGKSRKELEKKLNEAIKDLQKVKKCGKNRHGLIRKGD